MNINSKKKLITSIVSVLVLMLIVLGTTYAVTQVASKDVSYDNSKSGIISTNMQGGNR